MSQKGSCCNSNVWSITLGIIFGIITSLAWYFKYILYVREMMPYACAFSIVVLVATAILRLVYGNSVRESDDEFGMTPTILSLRKHSMLVIVNAVIFIVFALTHMATYPSLPVRSILSFVGSVAFWTMIFGFIDMVSFRMRRR